MSDAYSEFLSSKEPRHVAAGREPLPVPSVLFPWQAQVVRWAVRLGRAGLFAAPGLGKTPMQVAWALNFARAGERVLIVAPLGVTAQTIEMARDLLGVEVVRVREVADLRREGIFITNYERLSRFVDVPFNGIVLDESSILKSIDGKTRTLLLQRFTTIPHRLCCTATPAPNDVAEYANHAEFLGAMTRVEMLATFFVHDMDGKDAAGGWRLKGHARDAFYRWMARWAVFVRSPSDLGFPDDGYALPPLEVVDEVVRVEGDVRPGELFASGDLGGVGGRAQARRASLDARVARTLEIVRSEEGSWLVWCGLNDEGRAVAKALGDASVLVEGKDDEEEKVEGERRWRRGETSVLVTKPSIFGHGLNWQHCHRMIFLGLGDSYEEYYQALRRCYRFGQMSPVRAYVVLSEREGEIAVNVRRKEAEASEVAAAVVAAVRDTQIEEVSGVTTRTRDEYRTDEASGKDGSWRLLLGDCVERVREVPDASVGLSIYSPPFAALYTYSNSARDLGNAKNYDEFFRHYRFLIGDLLRATMHGRRSCVHVQQVTTTKATHGVTGWRDFRADVVRAHVEAGWVYDGEVVIDKDPQAQAIRTKSKALLFVQKDRDSAASRPAMADYVLLFYRPGENPEPVKTDVTNEEWIAWARPIWYGIKETETLQHRDAREANDEKHICPLQLETIERCVRLWSNRGDVVLSPFAGIGSEVYVAARHGRRGLGIELKESYWRLAVANLRALTSQTLLFDPHEVPS